MAVAKVISFTRRIRDGVRETDVSFDSGGGARNVGEHFADAGDDSSPLLSDFCISIFSEGQGRDVVCGYADPSTPPKALPGEKRSYSRDPKDGTTVAQVWLKSTGEVEILNDLGHIRLQDDGEVNINGVRITTSGDVITASGVSLSNHPHDQGADSDSNAQVATNPPTATE